MGNVAVTKDIPEEVMLIIRTTMKQLLEIIHDAERTKNTLESWCKLRNEYYNPASHIKMFGQYSEMRRQAMLKLALISFYQK